MIRDDDSPSVPSRCVVLYKVHFSFFLWFIILIITVTFTFIIPLLYSFKFCLLIAPQYHFFYCTILNKNIRSGSARNEGQSLVNDWRKSLQEWFKFFTADHSHSQSFDKAWQCFSVLWKHVYFKSGFTQSIFNSYCKEVLSKTLCF